MTYDPIKYGACPGCLRLAAEIERLEGLILNKHGAPDAIPVLLAFDDEARKIREKREGR